MLKNKKLKKTQERVRLLEGPYLASEFTWWVYATGAIVAFSPFQYCMCLALTSIHENIFSKTSGDGKPVNTLTQLSHWMWWNCHATWRSKLAWVDWSTWQTDMCFVNCLPSRVGFFCVTKNISTDWPSLCQRGSCKVTRAEKQSWIRILTCRFALLEMIGAHSHFLTPLKIC